MDRVWVGRWRNQFGSEVVIADVVDGVVSGTFTTALGDSALHGQTVVLSGTCNGDAIAVTAAGAGTAVSYTGTLRDGRLETLWTFATSETPWWRSVTINHDTFERV